MERIAVAVLVGALAATPILGAETTSGGTASAQVKKAHTPKHHTRAHHGTPKHAPKAASSHTERPAE
jgi:hypothetical protein